MKGPPHCLWREPTRETPRSLTALLISSSLVCRESLPPARSARLPPVSYCPHLYCSPQGKWKSVGGSMRTITPAGE